MDLVSERREKRRFALVHTIRFRLSAKRPTSRWAIGTIQDMSSNGISFRCRRPLPLGGHLELVVDWPAPLDDQRLVSLHASPTPAPYPPRCVTMGKVASYLGRGGGKRTVFDISRLPIQSPIECR